MSAPQGRQLGRHSLRRPCLLPVAPATQARCSAAAGAARSRRCLKSHAAVSVPAACSQQRARTVVRALHWPPCLPDRPAAQSQKREACPQRACTPQQWHTSRPRTQAVRRGAWPAAGKAGRRGRWLRPHAVPAQQRPHSEQQQQQQRGRRASCGGHLRPGHQCTHARHRVRRTSPLCP